jgi:hypothetical protein
MPENGYTRNIFFATRKKELVIHAVQPIILDKFAKQRSTQKLGQDSFGNKTNDGA